MELPPGADLRLPRYRRETWQRFYSFHLMYASHPGCVYFVLPALAEAYGWDAEQRYWCAWLNANTQNPVTTLLLMEAGDTPARWREVADYQQANWHVLAWDTDRKYQKAVFPQACERYAEITGKSQSGYWRGVTDWGDAWARMTALPYMGRLSAWSGLEYVRLLGDQPVPDAETLLLEDAAGSRSHRNGMALLSGHDELVQDKQLNPGFTGKWPAGFLTDMVTLGDELLAEARERNPGHPDVGFLTMESALCTWKSWHKRNRRYPNVYADMLFDRLRWAEARHGHRFGAIWDARASALPPYLRLEDTPGDPGVSPVKQNHYRDTGEQVLMGHVWPEMWSGFDQAVQEGKFGVCR